LTSLFSSVLHLSSCAQGVLLFGALSGVAKDEEFGIYVAYVAPPDVDNKILPTGID